LPGYLAKKKPNVVNIKIENISFANLCIDIDSSVQSDDMIGIIISFYPDQHKKMAERFIPFHSLSISSAMGGYVRQNL